MYSFSVLMCIINNTILFNISNTKNRKIIDIKSDIDALNINLEKGMYIKLIRLGYEQTMERIDNVIKELKESRDIELNENSDIEINKNSDIEINENSDIEINKNSNIEINENIKLQDM